MNPLELHGPEFLGLYLLVLMGASALAFGLRWLLRLPAGAPPPEIAHLSPYEVAYLAGGERQVIDAALVRLIHRSAVVVAGPGTLSRRGDLTSSLVLPGKPHPLEEAVWQACGFGDDVRIDRVWQRAAAAAAQIRPRLENLRLVVTEFTDWAIRLLSAVPLVFTGLFGFMKLGIGLSRGRPVGFLIMLLIATGGIAVFLLWKRVLRTHRGDRALAWLRQENAALEVAAGRRLTELADDDLVLALGLFGMAALAGGPLSGLQMALRVPTQTTGGGSSCSSSSGGASCGSSCGGGGCGGGGCGGCGS
jgi:uncharacterized protein (TIGR04222 family)